jgi:hypothetical protein
MSEAERRTLENWAKRRKTAQGLALRVRSYWPARTAGPMSLWRRGWASAEPPSGSGGAGSWPGGWTGWAMSPGRECPTISDAQVEEVVVRTLEETPEGATHWSQQDLARQVGISPVHPVHRQARIHHQNPVRVPGTVRR